MTLAPDGGLLLLADNALPPPRPYDTIIDGANVALFGQNNATGGFQFGQIMRTVDMMQGLRPGCKVLVVSLSIRSSRLLPFCNART